MTPTVLSDLAEAAWAVRESAYLTGSNSTRVGCAALNAEGRIFVGCNLQHRYRSHDIHAEVNAIGSLMAAGNGSLAALLIAAERIQFTPCGACLDWIFEIGGPSCQVITQSNPADQLVSYTADQLMPHYPT